ncbi:GDSL-type esterase/lipase family protein [Psychrobacter sp. T6-1]|uniref:GDSL-type esterase/lipase family protein n=1 Tax=Psychrobacter sp. T6-1 TaxID=3457447 RepID=UPI003FD6457B
MRRLTATWALPILALSLATGCSQEYDIQVLPAGSRVVALGDSLTYGYGTTPQNNYPSVLTGLTGWQVINAGVNGDTSADVLARIDQVITLDPDLVLLGVGGNDVLRRVQSGTTSANITLAIEQLKAADIAVILIAEPYFSTSALFGRASDNPIYKQIAKSENVPLYSKRWSEVISSDKLKSDQIHPNAAGYRYFAEGLHAYLQAEGWTR